MALFNTLILTMTCPRCGASTEVEAEFRFGLRELSRYKLGDRLLWDGPGVRTPNTRPPGGNYTDEAYVECPICQRDFWLKIMVENDVITDAVVDPHKAPYIPD